MNKKFKVINKYVYKIKYTYLYLIQDKNDFLSWNVACLEDEETRCSFSKLEIDNNRIYDMASEGIIVKKHE